MTWGSPRLGAGSNCRLVKWGIKRKKEQIYFLEKSSQIFIRLACFISLYESDISKYGTCFDKKQKNLHSFYHFLFSTILTLQIQQKNDKKL